jgi:hypothetical protein
MGRIVDSRSLVPVGDQWFNARRYAIDWLHLDETMSTTFLGDPPSNESYLLWGADVLAQRTAIRSFGTDVWDRLGELTLPVLVFQRGPRH